MAAVAGRDDEIPAGLTNLIAGGERPPLPLTLESLMLSECGWLLADVSLSDEGGRRALAPVLPWQIMKPLQASSRAGRERHGLRCSTPSDRAACLLCLPYKTLNPHESACSARISQLREPFGLKGRMDNRHSHTRRGIKGGTRTGNPAPPPLCLPQWTRCLTPPLPCGRGQPCAGGGGRVSASCQQSRGRGRNLGEAGPTDQRMGKNLPAWHTQHHWQPTCAEPGQAPWVLPPSLGL